MQSQVVFASNNQGKWREVQKQLPGIELIPQSQWQLESVEETGLTFVENAIIKARYCAEHTQLPTLADDSGLVVPALGGAPGIYSARYAGENASAKQHYEKLLHELSDKQGDERRAYFYCVMVLMRHALDPTPIIVEGQWHGVILTNPQGEQGFGYDPVFFDESQKMTAAQMSLDAKNSLSHRGQALAKLKGSVDSVLSLW